MLSDMIQKDSGMILVGYDSPPRLSQPLFRGVSFASLLTSLVLGRCFFFFFPPRSLDFLMGKIKKLDSVISVISCSSIMLQVYCFLNNSSKERALHYQPLPVCPASQRITDDSVDPELLHKSMMILV